jgi:hypothetical protein
MSYYRVAEIHHVDAGLTWVFHGFEHSFVVDDGQEALHFSEPERP